MLLDGYLAVLMLAALPAVGNFAGGVLAEFVQVTQRTLSLALHAAAGVILGVVGVELVPTALQSVAPWYSILAFVAGGFFFLGVDQFINLIRARFGGDTEAGPWAIYFGTAVDLFTDGILIGTGANITFSFAALLALAQVPSDIPEGFATIGVFRRQGLSRCARLILIASFAVPIFLGATVSYWGLRGQPEFFTQALLALAAGILTAVIIEEIVPEAHKNGEARLATLLLIGGFALFALLSTYIG